MQYLAALATKYTNSCDFKACNHSRHERRRKPSTVASRVLLDEPYTDQCACVRRRVDLYLPNTSDNLPPLAIWIHGGAWNSGDRRLEQAHQPFVDRGVAFASLGYRLTQHGSPFPTQLTDCATAIRWLADHSKNYGYDPLRIGISGHSAGGHLAALLLLSQFDSSLPVQFDASVRLNAAVLWSAPFDLSRTQGSWPMDSFVWDSQDLYCRTFFPQQEYNEAFARWASPISHVQSTRCPIQLHHGVNDQIVPLEQAKAFRPKLNEHGGNTILHTHSFGHKLPKDAWEMTASYFEETL